MKNGRPPAKRQTDPVLLVIDEHWAGRITEILNAGPNLSEDLGEDDRWDEGGHSPTPRSRRTRSRAGMLRSANLVVTQPGVGSDSRGGREVFGEPAARKARAGLEFHDCSFG